MMHSDVKISGTNSGIYNILIAVSVFLVFLYVPLVQTVIDGKVVESFTVAENIDKDSGGFYLFLIFSDGCCHIGYRNLEDNVV